MWAFDQRQVIGELVDSGVAAWRQEIELGIGDAGEEDKERRISRRFADKAHRGTLVAVPDLVGQAAAERGGDRRRAIPSGRSLVGTLAAREWRVISVC